LEKLPNLDFNPSIFYSDGTLLKGKDTDTKYRDLIKKLDQTGAAFYFETIHTHVILGSRFLVQKIGGREERIVIFGDLPVQTFQFNTQGILDFFITCKSAIHESELGYSLSGIWEEGDIQGLQEVGIKDELFLPAVVDVLLEERVKVHSTQLSAAVSIAGAFLKSIQSFSHLPWNIGIAKYPLDTELSIFSVEAQSDIDLDSQVSRTQQKKRLAFYNRIYRQYSALSKRNDSISSRDQLKSNIIRNIAQEKSSDIISSVQNDIPFLVDLFEDNPVKLKDILSIASKTGIYYGPESAPSDVIDSFLPLLHKFQSKPEIFSSLIRGIQDIYSKIGHDQKLIIFNSFIQHNLFFPELGKDILILILQSKNREFISKCWEYSPNDDELLNQDWVVPIISRFHDSSIVWLVNSISTTVKSYPGTFLRKILTDSSRFLLMKGEINKIGSRNVEMINDWTGMYISTESRKIFYILMLILLGFIIVEIFFILELLNITNVGIFNFVLQVSPANESINVTATNGL